MKKGRYLYIDVLKIIAMFLVVLIHASAVVFYNVNVNSDKFMISNIYDSFARIGVPIFIMVSGAYFLNPKNNVDIKKIYKKNIFKIILVLLLSSSILEFVKYLFEPNSISIKSFIEQIILGDPILWFFYMLIGLYVITPILRRVTQSKDITVYSIGIFFIVNILIPSIDYVKKLEIIEPLFSQMSIGLVTGYVGYYMLGYYLSDYDVNKKTTKCIYVLGVASVILTFLLTQFYTIKEGFPDEFFYDYMSITVFFPTIALFLLIKNKFGNRKHESKIITAIAASTIYIYPIHRILMIICRGLNVESLILSFPLLTIPIYTVLLFVLSLGVAIFIGKILMKLEDKLYIKYIVYVLILLIIFILKLFL